MYSSVFINEPESLKRLYIAMAAGTKATFDGTQHLAAIKPVFGPPLRLINQCRLAVDETLSGLLTLLGSETLHFVAALVTGFRC